MTYSERSVHIEDWIDDINNAFQTGDRRDRKRKRQRMDPDVTPKAVSRKRAKILPNTPSLTNDNTDESEEQQPPSETSSRSSANQSSRSSLTRSKQTKRQRELEIRYNNTSLYTPLPTECTEWKENAAKFPLFESLLAAIKTREKYNEHPTLNNVKLEKILHAVSTCRQKNSNEDQWSDVVVFPCLKKVQKVVADAPTVLNIINVQVFPNIYSDKD